MRRFPPEVKSRAVGQVLDDHRAVRLVAGELGIGASTLRTWVRVARQRRRADWWAEQVAPVFDFLTGYGFVLADVRAADWWEICAVFRAERSAVMVVYSVEFYRVEVRLIRAALLDLPGLSTDRVFLTGVPGLHGHLADWLLRRPYPDRRKRFAIVRSHSGLEPDRVASALEFWARVVRDHASDFLRGDLSILDDWERRPGRLAVTVHVPRKATPAEEAAAVGRTRAVFPQADVVTTRYPRPEGQPSRRAPQP